MSFDRRQFLNYFVVGGTMSALWNVGCGSSSDESITLTFQESDDFYSQLCTAINEGRDVQVAFDGTNRIGKDSRLLNEILPQANNRQDVYGEIEKLGESQDGRDTLRRAFTDELVETRVATKEMQRPNSKIIGPDGEVIGSVTTVIEPATTTVLLLTAVLLAAATVYGAHKHMEMGQPFRAEIELGPIFSFKFHSEPNAQAQS